MSLYAIHYLYLLSTQLKGNHTMAHLHFITLSDFFEYWTLFSGYVSVGTIFLWAFLGGLLGFVMILVAEIVWRKKITIKRRYKFLQYITYLYFIFFPLYAGFCFTQWFGLHAIEGQVVKNIPAILGETNLLFNEHLREKIEELVGKESLNFTVNSIVDTGLDSVSETIASFDGDVDTLSLKEKSAILVTSQVVKSGVVKSQVKSQASSAVGEGLALNQSHVEELMSTEINSLLETGVVNVVVEKQIKSFFGGLKMQILLIFLLGMAIPIGEIVLAHYLEKKRLTEFVKLNQD